MSKPPVLYLAMRTATGLDVLVRDGFNSLKGRRIGLLCNQASVDHRYDHILDLLLPLHRRGELVIQSVLGPQHGLFGHTQDNMIEWEGQPDARTGIIVHSLYGESRKPTPKMLEGVELLVVDIPDVGSRYYTFVWTMAHCIDVCAELGIPVLVLDRPNPIGGHQVEGTLLQHGFESFVGLHEVPTRHGMTAGEVAFFVRDRYYPKAQIAVRHVEGWSRADYLDDTDAPWAMPSPNMPTVDTAVVYPGGCLLEATNLSEGRGTTRPFEIVGAPFLDAWKFSDGLNAIGLPGVKFRPLQFQPTFNKHAGKVCGGTSIHVTDRRAFEPVLTTVALLQEVIRQAGIVSQDVFDAIPVLDRFDTNAPEIGLNQFAWKLPPYEYEFEKLPIDILAGNEWLRPAIESLSPIVEIRQRFLAECDRFTPVRREYMLYPT